MKKYLVTVGDTNDGDYDTKIKEITDEQIEKFKPIIEAIKAYEGDYNFLTGEVAQDQDEDNAEILYGNIEGFKEFKYFVPNGDPNYSGIHTLESIKLLVVQEETQLL